MTQDGKTFFPAFTQNRRKNVRLVSVIFLSALAAMVIFFLLSGVMGIGNLSEQNIDDTLSVDVIHLNGDVVHSDSNYFLPAHKGDVIEITVPLKEEQRQEYAALCFSFYNSLIRVSYKDRVLYRYGEERVEAGRQIGHLVISVPIPEEAWGDSLLITAVPQENNSTSSIRNVNIMPAVNARAYPQVGKEFDFLIFLTLLVFSVTSCIAFMLAWLLGYRQITQGIFLSLALVSVCSWYLGYQELFYLFSDNIPLCANVEYIALYAFPIPFLAYIRRENLPGSSRWVMGALELVFILLLAVVLGLCFSPVDMKFIDFLTPLRILIFGTIVLTMMVLLYSGSLEQDVSEKVLRYGQVVTMAVSALELIRITVDGVTGLAVTNKLVRVYVHMNFSRAMILVFLFVLLSSYSLRLSGMVRTNMERQQLEKLAFTDLLTGIPNRQDCERNIDDMDETQQLNCVVFFLDVNDLKMANDVYSHDVGDELLRQVAAALHRTMTGHEGFYGRYGGDEFLACVYRKEEAETVKEDFFKAIEEINRRKLLPFPVQVACGMVTYQEMVARGQESGEEGMSFRELILLADERMYENKQAMKKQTAEGIRQTDCLG